MSRVQSKQNILPPVQNVDATNPTNEVLTQNKEGNTLIWYDTSLSITDQDTINTKKALRAVNDYVLLFDNEEKCVQHIGSTDVSNVFMVISGSSAITLLSQIHELKQGNEKVLKEIDKFNEHYEIPSHALHFYTCDSFWYRTINHIFRIQDLELLEIFHFFIVDLSEELKERFERLKTSLSSSEQKTLILYRGHKFSKEEYHRFSSCTFARFNSYLSTSSDIEVAKIFAGFTEEQTSSDPDIVQVLFHIELDIISLNSNSVIVADISTSSQYEEECEYLFDFGATFEIISANHKDQIIKMIVSDKPQHLAWARLNGEYLYKYASQEIIDHIEIDPVSNNFASDLIEIHKSLTRLDAFENYILNTSIDDDNYQTASKHCIEGYTLSHIHPSLLYARECRKLNPTNPYTDEHTNAYNQAIKYFQAFYNYASDDFIKWALRALGFAHYKIDDYEQAQIYFNKALKIDNDPLNFATCCYFIGCIYSELSDHEKSMNYFNEVLQLKDRIKLSFIAATYRQMAMLKNQNKEKDYPSSLAMAKEYLLNALNIYQQTSDELSTLRCRSELLNLEGYTNIDDCTNILDQYFKYCQDHQIVSKPIAEL
ncbi:unnamed protein product, partial [Rotaria sp. Silwood1]